MKLFVYVLMMAGLLSVGCGQSNSPQGKTSVARGEQNSALWLTDFEQAKKVAEERKLPILANFSGSDWCGWCIRLDEEVFSKDDFKEYARSNLVLFVADFPNRKEQPAELKAQNKALAEQHDVRGFPTILLMNAEGKVLARTGYVEGGPELYIEHLKTIGKQN